MGEDHSLQHLTAQYIRRGSLDRLLLELLFHKPQLGIELTLGDHRIIDHCYDAVQALGLGNCMRHAG